MPDDTMTELHRSALVIDGTCPGSYWFDNYSAWINGGASCCVVTVATVDDARQTVESISRTLRFIRERNQQLCLATSADDILSAKQSGRLGVVLQFQGTDALEQDLGLAEVYWRLGVRVMQLTYNRQGEIGAGCEVEDEGLTPFGHAAISEMNRLGIVVDVSHGGERTSLDAVAASTAPVVASHSNPSALHASRRNISDELIRSLAAGGGLVGINGFSGFLGKAPIAPLDSLIDHLLYVIELTGIDHVALGLDYMKSNPPYDEYVARGMWLPDTYPRPPWHFPAGLDTPAGLPNLTARLLERNFSPDEILAILGGNWLRMFDNVWK